MRDPLFERRDDYLAHANALQEAVRAQIDDLPDPDQLVENLTAWCRAALRESEADMPDHARPLLEVLSLYGTTASPSSTKEGLAALVADVEHPQRDLAAWLLGHALANLLVDELASGNAPSLLLPPNLEGGPSSLDLTHAAFHESLRSRLADLRAVRQTLLSHLQDQVDHICDAPGLGTYTSDRDRFLTFVREWTSNPTLDALWQDPGDTFLVDYHVLDLFPTIMSVERQAVLNLMDRFRFPHPIDQVLTSHAILYDRDEISAALKAAPACSDDGRIWNGSHLAPLLLRTAEEHARRLWEAARAGPASEPKDDEPRALLAVWFEELARLVLQRPDGQFLASQWALAKLVDERRSRHLALTEEGQASGRFLPQIILIEMTFTGLATAGLTGDAITAGIDFPTVPTNLQVSPTRSSPLADEEANPCLRALCARDLVDSSQRPTSTDHALSLLDQLDALLLHRDPAFDIEFSLATNAHDLPASRCGSLLASSTDAAERWLRSWNALAEQRRRAQHWLHTDDADAIAPSMFLLASGVAALDWMLSNTERQDVNADVLWRHLFDAARECWLTLSLTHLVQRLEAQIQRLFARHPRVFGNPPDDSVPRLNLDESSAREGNYATLLAEDLGLLGGDDAMVAHCYLAAQLNGVQTATLDAVRRHNSNHIDSSLRQFMQWQALERPNRRLQHLLAQLPDLRTPLDDS